jgi:hypothetical protein
VKKTPQTVSADQAERSGPCSDDRKIFVAAHHDTGSLVFDGWTLHTLNVGFTKLIDLYGFKTAMG